MARAGDHGYWRLVLTIMRSSLNMTDINRASSSLICLKSLDVTELKKLKINREDDLLNRDINYINNCGTHKSSKYCHLVSLRNVKS